jgi:hypothetical protein
MLSTSLWQLTKDDGSYNLQGVGAGTAEDDS